MRPWRSAYQGEGATAPLRVRDGPVVRLSDELRSKRPGDNPFRHLDEFDQPLRPIGWFHGWVDKPGGIRRGRGNGPRVVAMDNRPDRMQDASRLAFPRDGQGAAQDPGVPRSGWVKLPRNMFRRDEPRLLRDVPILCLLELLGINEPVLNFFRQVEKFREPDPRVNRPMTGPGALVNFLAKSAWLLADALSKRFGRFRQERGRLGMTAQEGIMLPDLGLYAGVAPAVLEPAPDEPDELRLDPQGKREERQHLLDNFLALQLTQPGPARPVPRSQARIVQQFARSLGQESTRQGTSASGKTSCCRSRRPQSTQNPSRR